MVFAGKKLRSAAERLQKAAYELMAAGGAPAKVTRRLGGRLVSCFGRCKPWVSGFQTGCQIIRPDLFYFTKEALILEMIGSFILSCWGLVMPCGKQWQYTWPRWRWLHDPPDTLRRQSFLPDRKHENITRSSSIQIPSWTILGWLGGYQKKVLDEMTIGGVPS